MKRLLAGIGAIGASIAALVGYVKSGSELDSVSEILGDKVYADAPYSQPYYQSYYQEYYQDYYGGGG